MSLRGPAPPPWRQDLRGGVAEGADRLERAGRVALVGGRRGDRQVALVEARHQQARAEVEEAHAVAMADHDVVGLHVAVHDADLVRGVQNLGEIDRQAERALGLDLPVLERGGERDAGPRSPS
jgi:hypothetical protein